MSICNFPSYLHIRGPKVTLLQTAWISGQTKPDFQLKNFCAKKKGRGRQGWITQFCHLSSACITKPAPRGQSPVLQGEQGSERPARVAGRRSSSSHQREGEVQVITPIWSLLTPQSYSSEQESWCSGGITLLACHTHRNLSGLMPASY